MKRVFKTTRDVVIGLAVATWLELQYQWRNR